MHSRRILILGGTVEARLLAGKARKSGFEVVTSLAGVTQRPEPAAGVIRRGGFGGADGLAEYLRTGGFAALIDATHPFAEQISRHAKSASEAVNIMLCRLQRPAWRASSNDYWIEVNNAAGAVAALPPGARALVTVGRKEAATFLSRPDISGVMRMIEPPAEAFPANWRLILARPPFTVTQELELMVLHDITHLVAKNSGSEQTHAKILAARERKIPVVLMQRPQKTDVPTFETPDEVIAVLCRALSA